MAWMFDGSKADDLAKEVLSKVLWPKEFAVPGPKTIAPPLVLSHSIVLVG